MYIYTQTQTHRHTHTQEYYSALKKNEILPFAAIWMDKEGIMLSEISQTGKDKYHMISLMWNLKNKTKEQTKQKLSNIQKTNKWLPEVGGWINGKGEGN